MLYVPGPGVLPADGLGRCDEPNEYAGDDGIRTAFPRRLAGMANAELCFGAGKLTGYL